MTSGPSRRDWSRRLMEHIRDAGGRVTGPRMRVAEVFFGMSGHPGVEELAAEVHKRHKGIGYATVYRTMKLLRESGLAAVREFGDGYSRYEAQAPEEHHDHLICTSCGRITEFEHPVIESLQERVTREHAFRMTHHRLEIYGQCRSCAAKEARRRPR